METPWPMKTTIPSWWISPTLLLPRPGGRTLESGSKTLPPRTRWLVLGAAVQRCTTALPRVKRNSNKWIPKYLRILWSEKASWHWDSSTTCRGVKLDDLLLVQGKTIMPFVVHSWLRCFLQSQIRAGPLLHCAVNSRVCSPTSRLWITTIETDTVVPMIHSSRPKPRVSLRSGLWRCYIEWDLAWIWLMQKQRSYLLCRQWVCWQLVRHRPYAVSTCFTRSSRSLLYLPEPNT